MRIFCWGPICEEIAMAQAAIGAIRHLISALKLKLESCGRWLGGIKANVITNASAIRR